MNIDEFILARVAEEERMARTALASTADVDGGISWWWVRFGDNSLTWEASPVPPSRVLAECRAKRRIVELHAVNSEIEQYGTRKGATIYWCDECDHDRDYGHIGSERAGCDTLHTLAAFWSDHPDYRSEWAA